MENNNNFMYGNDQPKTNGMMDSIGDPYAGGSNGMMDSLDPNSANVGGMDSVNANANYGGAQNAYNQTNAYAQNGGYNGQAAAGTATKRYTADAYENPGQFSAGTAYTPINQRIAAASNENVALGVVGAVIGTMLGLVVWCIIGAMGFISWIGGLALVAGAFFGYILLAKDIGKTGTLIVALLVIASVYIGTRLTYAISIHKVLKDEFESYDLDAETLELSEDILGFDIDASTPEIFVNLNDYLDAVDGRSDFNGDLAYGYLFTIAASAAFIAKRRKR